MGRCDARYPAQSIEQACAIQALRERFRKDELVGWYLWFAGYQVDDCFWKPHLLRAARSFETVRRKAAAVLDSDIDAEFDQFVLKLRTDKIDSKAMRNIRKDAGTNLNALADILLQIACGQKIEVVSKSDLEALGPILKPVFGKTAPGVIIEELNKVALINSFGGAVRFVETQGTVLVDDARAVVASLIQATGPAIALRRAAHILDDKPLVQAGLILALAMVRKRSNKLESGPRRTGY